MHKDKLGYMPLDNDTNIMLPAEKKLLIDSPFVMEVSLG
jgi:hypothetical protein